MTRSRNNRAPDAVDWPARCEASSAKEYLPGLNPPTSDLNRDLVRDHHRGNRLAGLLGEEERKR